MSDDGESLLNRRLLDGRYRLVERVGAGPGGVVWRAFDEAERRDVAVKELCLKGTSDDSDEARRAVHRLLHEARAAARVDHPAAVRIHDALLEDGLPWTVMELIRGESLEAVLQRGGVLSGEAARIGLAVLGALRAAHSVGIVHRDLKPANVLIESGSGRVVVTDFGTGHGGQLDFLSPEQLSGPGAGPASDLWSLGMLLHVAVEGDLGALGPLVRRLLVREPGARPGADEVARVLAEVAAEGATEGAVERAVERGAVVFAPTTS